MKFLLHTTILFIFLSNTASAFAALPASVNKALNKMGIPASAVSVYVQPVESTEPSLTHMENRSMNPASVMKLVTTYSALELLGPAFRWKTEVYRDGPVVNGVLKGNLVIKGYGDPSFKPQDFWRLLMRLRQTGIHTIEGDLIIDKTYFDASVDNGKPFDNEKWRAYNTQPTAFLVNGRHTSFRFEVVDGRVKIDQEFALPQVTLMNNLRVKKGGCGSWRSHYQYHVVPTTTGVLVSFDGQFSEKCGTRYLELSVMNDTQYAFFTFVKLWRELGGSFNGRLSLRPVSEATDTLLVTHDSQPLSYVINDLNKWSINVMARHLLLTIAAEQHGVPATAPLAAQTVKNWLADKKLFFKELVIENGSGLSRVARVNAKHLGQMLVNAYHSPVMPELMSSLSIMGVDGTAKKRLRNTQAQGHGHLKTGSLRGVSAIAGYVLDRNGKRHAVAIMVSHAKTWGAKKVQDAVLQWVYAGR